MQEPQPASIVPPRTRLPQVPPQTRISYRGQISPKVRLSANVQKPSGMPSVANVPNTPPLTPRRLYMQGTPEHSPVKHVRAGTPFHTGIPATPPCSIPGYFVNDEAERSEPGVGETLMGCGMLLLMAVVVVAVLYYLMT